MVVAPRVRVTPLVSLLAAASASASAPGSSSACLRASAGQAAGLTSPVQITGPAPASMLAQFAVLRRPRGTADLLPEFANAGEALATELGSYDPDTIRLLGPGEWLVLGRAPVISPPRACLSPKQRRQLPTILRRGRPPSGSRSCSPPGSARASAPYARACRPP
ncbi:MAG TPA: hypothetical protein VHX88_18960 [Solirubrobacteraceae bacterium]|nr:hypothetical protein [Solirubrobacteraceae bacterium]